MEYTDVHRRLRAANEFDRDQELEIEWDVHGGFYEVYLTRSQVEDLVDHLMQVLEAR